MGLLSGATSLVELVLKKYGDDTAGAAKELERLAGFPTPVARRIASGELPMDPKSVADRKANFEDAEGLHGSTHNLLRFDADYTNADNDMGKGIYITDSATDASVNYAGEGADLTNRLERHADMNEFQDFMGDDDVRYIGGRDWTGSEWDELTDDQRREFLLSDARDEIKGDNQGVIYPLSVNHNKVVHSDDYLRDTLEIREASDYMDEAADSLLPSLPDVKNKESLLDPNSEYADEVWDEAMNLMYSDHDSPDMTAYRVLREYGFDEGAFEFEGLKTWQDLRDVIQDKIDNGWYPQDMDGEYVSSGRMMQDIMQEFGIKGYTDGTSYSRFSGMEGGAGEHTIMFPDSERQIRSQNAAFDPQYTGKNMMGEATVPLLGATALGTAGLLAAPALMKEGFPSWEEVSRDPTAPLPAPAFGEQMGKAGEVLMTILDAPMTGWQGIARGLSGVMNGEDVVTAGAEANHMMKGGSEEGFDRLGDKVEGLLSPIDKRFPYLNAGKSAGDTVGLLASLIAPF